MVNGSHEPQEGCPSSHDSAHTRFLFPPGQIVATPGALCVMEEHGINAGEILRRHASGDWSGLCEEDRAENGRAAPYGVAVPLRLRRHGAWNPLSTSVLFWLEDRRDDRPSVNIVKSMLREKKQEHKSRFLVRQCNVQAASYQVTPISKEWDAYLVQRQIVFYAAVDKPFELLIDGGDMWSSWLEPVTNDFAPLSVDSQPHGF